MILENDANSAAFGEKWLGVAKDVDDMAMLTLGTGVGGGLVLGGRIWHGMAGMAAEFGHTTVEPDGALCGCGNRGCLEAYASATAVVRMAREAIASGAAPGLAQAANSDVEFSAKAVYNLAIQGDEAGAEDLSPGGAGAGDCALRYGERVESSHVCDWRRSFERVGRVCAGGIRGIAAALHGVCGYLA